MPAKTWLVDALFATCHQWYVQSMYMDRMLYTDIFDTTIRSLSKKIADYNI